MSPVILNLTVFFVHVINLNSKLKVNWLFLLAAGGIFQNTDAPLQMHCTK